MKAHILFVIEVKRGRLIYKGRTIEKPLVIERKSFVKNFVGYLRVGLTGQPTDLVDVQGRTGTLNPFNLPATGALCYEGADFGIILGKGSTPVSINDYKLEDPIQHGTGSGQLYYYDCSVGSVTTSRDMAYFEITRDIENKSSSNIQFQEIGLIATTKLVISGSEQWTNVLFAREVLDNPVTFASGARATFKAKIYVMIPP